MSPLYNDYDVKAAIEADRPILLVGTPREAEMFAGSVGRQMTTTAGVDGWSPVLARQLAGATVIVAAVGLRPTLHAHTVDELLAAGATRAKYVRLNDWKRDELVAAANRVAWRWRVTPPRALLVRTGADEWVVASPLNRVELAELVALIATELRA